MSFRVPAFQFSQQAIRYSTLHNAEILKFQQQIASGKRFELPSQAPIEFRQVTSLQARFEELAADRQSIERATSLLNASVAQMQDFADVMNQAKSLTLQAVQTLDQDERTAMALEVDGLLSQLKSIASSQYGGRFLYAGMRSDTPPFAFSDPQFPGGPLGVDYLGANVRSRASVNGSIDIDTYYVGADVFGAGERGATVFLGETGAQPGSGTDSLSTHSQLWLTHDTTSYAGTSGVQPGASSADLDTILGQLGSHQLTIVDTAGDGSAGTVSLNGAEAMDFTDQDVDLRVTGNDGQVIYLDLSSIAPGFNGTIDIESTGSLSVDRGTSSTPIDFTGNQLVTDGSSGRILTVDTTAVRRVGTEHVEFPGSSNAFQVLHALASDLRNERGLEATQLTEVLNLRLGDIEAIASNAYATMGEQSTSLRTMESLLFRVEDLQLATETELSEVQATDLPEAVLRLQNAQTLLQYNYSVTANLLQLGIIQFLN